MGAQVSDLFSVFFFRSRSTEDRLGAANGHRYWKRCMAQCNMGTAGFRLSTVFELYPTAIEWKNLLKAEQHAG